MASIIEITAPDSIARCYPVMAQLRPHLTREAFVAQVLDQFETQRYHLAAVLGGEEPVAVAGYRFGRCLAWGHFLYVDDLITDEAHRGAGYGGQLLDWLVAKAREGGCAEFHLDSGVHRFAAHRFYLTKRMDITSHHFGMKL